MNIYSYQEPPRWWGPRLSPFFFRVWRGVRSTARRRKFGICEVEVRGIEKLTSAMKDGRGVLITPNHSSHADPLVLCKTSEIIGKPFYYMAAWQVFARSNLFRRFVLRQHGCFSVDREGTDMRAFRQAVDILQNKDNPLVIFPEGEIYHVNDKLTPFRDGPAAMAITASKRAKQEVLCVPCGVKYEYVDDPTENLIELMGRLEETILWRVRDDVPLGERIYRFAEAMLGLKELEYFGAVQTGELAARIKALAEFVLARIEGRYELSADGSLPERVKGCRRAAIKRLEEAGEDEQAGVKVDLDDLYIATQLFSYPGDYVASKPTIERIAETFDKFEEDILKEPTPGIRGRKKATVCFGEAIVITPDAGKKIGVHALTEMLESRVQGLLDELNG